MPVDAYIRVSQVKGRTGERFISPTLQRDKILAWAATNGVVIGTVFEELDQSGAKADRPMLLEALQRIDDKISDGLVVARMDRFGRSLLHSLNAIERIDRAGGTFVSVNDGLDLRTDTGRLVLRIMLSLAEWELDRIRSTWDESRRIAVANGRHIASVPPCGYRRDKNGDLEPDPASAPFIAEMFRRRGEGDTYRSLCRYLVDNHVVTGHGNHGWTMTALSNLIRNPVYKGDCFSGIYVNKGRHTPLVDLPTWHRAQRPGRPNLNQQRRYPAALLAGLLRCAGCEYMLASSRQRDRQVYRCQKHHAAASCLHAASTLGAPIEEITQNAIDVIARRRRLPSQTARLHKTRLGLEKAEAALIRYRDNTGIENTIGPDRYVQGLKHRMDMVERAALLVNAAQLQTPDTIPDDWRSLPQAERRRIIREHIDCIYVHDGQLPIADRIFICYRGEQPAHLGKRRGHGRRTPRQFDPATTLGAAPGRPRTIAFDAWPEALLEERLLAFLGTRRHLPQKSVFVTADQDELYKQILGAGGPGPWAAKLGITRTLPTRPRLKWTDPEIEQHARAYLQGHTEIPRRSQWERDGQRNLYVAILNNHGIEWWSHHLGLPAPHFRRYPNRGPRPRRAPGASGP